MSTILHELFGLHEWEDDYRTTEGPFVVGRGTPGAVAVYGPRVADTSHCRICGQVRTNRLPT